MRYTIEGARSRFIQKTVADDSGCIIWTGGLGSHKRYGVVGINGKTWLAHRAAWFLFTGEDPGTSTVCHKCDNGLCVNVDHLFLGTQGDNVRDMETKGRGNHPRNENHGRAKLTNKDVIDIRILYSNGASIRSLAKAYNISPPCIKRAVDGSGWVGVV